MPAPPFRFITALYPYFHSFFSSPFFLFMGFHCSCSRQDIAIPCCCHAAFFPVYVAMLQYYRVCHAATRYRSVAVNSRPSATLAEIRVFISAFCLLQLGFLYLAFILPEVFFRQAAFYWNRSRSTSRCGNSAVERVAAAGGRTPGNAASVPFQPGSSCRVSFVTTVTE